MDLDPQYIAYLDAKLEGFVSHVDTKLEGFVSHVDAKFADIDLRFEDMQGQMDLRFEDMQGQMDLRFKETREDVRKTHEQVLKNQAEIQKNREQIGNAKVMIEELGSRVQAVAEGHTVLSGKIDRVVEEIKTERQQDRGEIRSAQRKLRKRVERLEAAIQP